MAATRRALILATVTLPLASTSFASADETANSELIKCYLVLDKTSVAFGDTFSFVACVEAIKTCRVYSLGWGYLRGLGLYVEGPDGKWTAPPFHPPTDLPAWQMFANAANFELLYPGRVLGIRTTVPAKDVFSARGEFKLRLAYLPEPTKSFTSVKLALVAEGGLIESPPVGVTVV